MEATGPSDRRAKHGRPGLCNLSTKVRKLVPMAAKLN
jgi:hypothetical protein